MARAVDPRREELFPLAMTGFAQKLGSRIGRTHSRSERIGGCPQNDGHWASQWYERYARSVASHWRTTHG